MFSESRLIVQVGHGEQSVFTVLFSRKTWLHRSTVASTFKLSIRRWMPFRSSIYGSRAVDGPCCLHVPVFWHLQ